MAITRESLPEDQPLAVLHRVADQTGIAPNKVEALLDLMEHPGWAVVLELRQQVLRQAQGQLEVNHDHGFLRENQGRVAALKQLFETLIGGVKRTYEEAQDEGHE